MSESCKEYQLCLQHRDVPVRSSAVRPGEHAFDVSTDDEWVAVVLLDCKDISRRRGHLLALNGGACRAHTTSCGPCVNAWLEN